MEYNVIFNLNCMAPYMQTIPITKSGKEALEKTLAKLKKVDRPQIIEEISVARELGDLKENAEYHAAREKQGLTEALIRDLEDKICRFQVIDISKIPNNGKVLFGCYVVLENQETEQQTSYQIVGEDESDVEQNKISVTSPLARAVIGKEEGDSIEVKLPKGIALYEIIKVSYNKS